MSPQPQFEYHIQHLKEPEKGVEISPVDASNDPAFRNFEHLSTTELFQRRKAHEITARLAFRDPQIDKDEIMRIENEMAKRGLTEEAYQQFLSTYEAGE